MPIAETDLLIVGAGPAGLLASSIASSIGLPHMVVEARPTTHVHPSAHVIKTHSMEVYRRIGAASAIDAVATPAAAQRYVHWCESLTGRIHGKLDLAGKKGPGPRFSAVSPTHSANLPQSVLEPILLRRAQALATDPIHFGQMLVDLMQDDDGVTATIEGAAGPHQVRCRYLIGADGANSRVRQLAGIAMEGPAVIADFIAINIESDLEDVIAERPGVLFFVRQPDLEGVFIVHQQTGQQVFMMRFDPDRTPFEAFGTERSAELVKRAVGFDHRFTITGIGRWAMSAQVADRYRKGRVLIAGDAAHRFPPTGGLGLNTGVEDVENLLWKLAAVIRQQAGPQLLDSYEAECRPVALRNTAQSVENNARMQEIEDALTDTGDTPERRATRIDAAIASQIKHFAHLEFEMAAKIETGAIVPTDRRIAHPVPEVESFQPSFRPGNAMPHLWLEPDRSTIDCLRFDRMTLFAPPQDVAAWQAAVDKLDADMMPIEVVTLALNAAAGCVTASDFWGGSGYAILVRPDGRIGWVEPEAVPDRRAALAAVMASLLPRTPSTAEAVFA